MKNLVVGDDDCSINAIVCVIEKLSSSVDLREKWTTLARNLNAPLGNIKKWKQDLLLERQNVLDICADMLSDWRSRLGDDARFEDLLNILGNECGWKVVEDTLWQTFMTNMTENISWDDLDMRSRNKIMESQVKFQGQIKSMRDILSRFDETEVQVIMQSKLLGTTILKLLGGERISLLNDLMPETPSYYVPRMLNSRKKINPDIFQKKCPDIFVIQGITLSELSKLAGVQGIAKTSNQQKKLMSRFILLDVPNGFEIIAAMSNEVPIHQLSLQNENYFWMKSSGSFDLIQEYIHSDQDAIPEEEFLLNLQEDHDSKQPVCIADIPGMGKTCLLANLAQQRKCNAGNEALVFFISLPKFLDTRDCTAQQGICKDNLCSMIAKYVSEYELGQEIVAKALHSDLVGVELFFDAFDELPSLQQEFTINMINSLLMEFKLVNITISTRVHKRHELEQSLNTLSYNIQPFQHEDQVQFLVRYWNKKCGVPIDDTLKGFSDFVASKVRTTLHSFETDVVGVPLQCSMLADIFTKDALIYSHAASISFELSVNIDSILDMYAALIAKRFGKYEQDEQTFIRNLHVLAAVEEVFPGLVSAEKLKKSLHAVDLNEINSIGILFCEKKENSVKYRFLHHSYAEYTLAVYLVESLDHQVSRPEHFIKLMSTDDVLKEAMVSINDESDVRVNTTDCPTKKLIGILEDSEECMDIATHWEALAQKIILNTEVSEIKVADTFMDAELFGVIFYWTQKLCSQPKLCHLLYALRSLGFGKAAENLKERLGLPVFKQKTFCFFIDSSLQQKTEFLNPKMPAHADFHIFANLLRMLRACLYHDFASLFALVSQHCLSMKRHQPSSFTGTSWCSLIVDAVKWSSLKLVSECCDFVELIEERNLCEMSCFKAVGPFVYTPLHAAVARGDFTIFDYLFKKVGSCVFTIKGLLHTCVKFSLTNSDKTISEKIQIIHWIKNANENSVNEIVGGLSPTREFAVHFKLLQCMIDIGADINIDKDGGDTVLHIAAVFLPPSDFHMFTEFLLERGHTKMFMMIEKSNVTPVYSRLFHYDVKLETIKLLSSHLGDSCFNILDAHGNNALFYAVIGGRKKPVLEMIVECGGDPKRLMKYKRSIVHAAAAFGNADAINYFVSLGCSVNARDNDGRTPLHLAFKLGYRNIEESVQILLANKVNVNIKDNLGHKAISYALEEDKVWMLEPSTRDILVKMSEEVPFYRKLLRLVTN